MKNSKPEHIKPTHSAERDTIVMTALFVVIVGALVAVPTAMTSVEPTVEKYTAFVWISTIFGVVYYMRHPRSGF